MIIHFAKHVLQTFLRSLGFEIRRLQAKNIKERDHHTIDFSVNRIFEFFGFWQSKIKIGDQVYGGTPDYTTVRISVLNVPRLYEYVDFKNKSVLELGPLEGGNAILLSNLGVSGITAIEGRIENYIKCCVIKNLLRLEKTNFVFDDVRNLSLQKYGKFDIALVAGILYHLDDPHILLEKVSQVADTIILSTHYADDVSPSLKAKERVLSTRWGSLRGKVYGEGSMGDPSAGLQLESVWLYEDDLMKLLRDVGYRDLTVIMKNPIPAENLKLIYLVGKK